MEDKIKYEKHWLKLLVEGDEKAYKRLFELYYSSLVMFAAKYLRDTDLAEDLVQDVIYDFWKQRQHLSELSSLKSGVEKSLELSDFPEQERVRWSGVSIIWNMIR